MMRQISEIQLNLFNKHTFNINRLEFKQSGTEVDLPDVKKLYISSRFPINFSQTAS